MKLLTMLAFIGLSLTPLVARAQTCDAVVADDGGVLSSPQLTQILMAANPLIIEGADVRVRTTPFTDNLDVVEKQYENNCSSWQGANGGRKNSLISLMVSPAGRKLGIYYGSAFKPALDGSWMRIKSDYMAPKFRDKDWVGGFVATEQQLIARITASKDEALHPVVSTTTNVVNEAATDYTELWKVFKLFLELFAFFSLIFFVSRYYSRKKKRKEEIAGAQQEAIIRRNYAVDRINKYKEEVSPKTQNVYDLAVEEFSRLMNSEKTNPDNEGMEVSQYQYLSRTYFTLYKGLDNVFRPNEEPEETEEPAEKKTTVYNYVSPKNPDVSRVPIPQPVAYTGGDTTIIAPIIIDPITEPVYKPEPEPEHHHHSSDDDNSFGSSSSDDSGGGSSSWDTGSSSSDFGGGSSDFGSFGGGDSGGGSSGF